MKVVCLGFLSLSLTVLGADSTNNSSPGRFGRVLDAILGGSKTETNQTTSTGSTNNIGTNVIGRPAARSSTSSSAERASTNQVNSVLKQTLEASLQSAVRQLSQSNAFLTNLQLRIRVPEQLAPIERGLRRIHEDALVDQFEATMNHAAEKAVPVASDIFIETARQVSLQDAMALLRSKSATAVTDYFQKAAATNLFEKFLPIVREATAQSGVTASYKQLLDRVPFVTGLFSKGSLDLDNYVTTKALDGLFKVAGDEEKRIRANPQGRLNELLQKVREQVGAKSQPSY